MREMHKYTFDVVENTKITFLVEAPNAQMAANLFERYCEDHEGTIHDELNANYAGYTIGKPEEADEKAYFGLDLSFEELEDSLYESLFDDIARYMTKLKLQCQDEGFIRDVEDRILAQTGYGESGTFTDSDIRKAIVEQMEENLRKLAEV